MILTVPADLEARAADIIGAPFLPKGDTPAGWDCRGLTRWCWREWCGVIVPDYQDLYAASIVSPSGRSARAGLLAAGLAEQYRPVEPQAGAVALLEWMGAAGHVGFMLSPRRLVHADTRCGTALLDLDDPAAGYRLRGAFVPAFITEIRQGGSMTDCAVPVVLSPEPFSRRTEYAKAPAGRTICAVLAEAVDAGQLALDDLARTSIYVDGSRLDHDAALDHVVAEGEIVNVVVEPLGGGGRGGKDVGQILLTIAIVAVSAWVSGGGLAAWGLEAGKLATRVAAASVMVLGQAATAALFAPDAASAAKANDRYALQSASNQFRQWAPFPLALGEVAVAPDLAVKTYTQTVGDESWIYGILGLHYGPCQVADLKIGDTLVSDMGASDVRIAQHLTPGPRTFSIVANDIDQTDLQEELTATTGSATAVVRAAGAEGERFDFDFFLPAGLYFAKDDGRKEPASVTVTIRSRPIDSNGNPTGGGAWSNALTIPLTGSSSDPMRITRSVDLPLNRYQFEVKRSVLVDSSAKRHTDIAWTAVRAIAFRKPITDETLSIIEFAVRATALNQGALAPITCRITPLAQTWTGATWGPAVPTSNPAALTRWLMTGPAPSRPLTSAQADVGLRAWSALCDTYDWKAHLYLTGDDRQDAAMKMLGHAGRAGVFWDGTQLVAATWAEKPAPRQMFAGGNLKDHRWTIVYPDEVHALRVEFQNLDEGGEPDELYVYADGYAETAGAGLTAATLIEALRLDGQMTLERAYRNGRWALGARIHQRRIDTWSTNMEHLACRYGDRVRLAWDRVSGVDCRVRCRRWSGSLVSGLRLSQPVTFTPGETYAADLRLSDQTLAAVPIVNPATTADVVTREITFGSPRAAALSPAGGDLIAFGLTERVSEDVEVLGMEPGPGLTANLTGMRYVAPLLMAGETGPIPPLQTRLTRDRFRDPPMPTLLGAVLDDTVLRISFSMPPWRGSPLTGFAARWRQAPAAGQTIGWTDLPDLPAGAMTLTTPTLRELPSTDDLTKVEIQITAMTASGRVSEPLSVTVTVATVATPGAGEWTVTIRPADPHGEQQPGLLVTGAVDATRVATVRIAYGTSSAGPWQEVYAGPPTAQAVPINGLSPNVDYWVAISYFSAQGVPSGFLVKGPYTAPGLIAGGVGGHSGDDLTARFDDMIEAFRRTAAAVRRVQAYTEAQTWIDGEKIGTHVSRKFETISTDLEQLATEVTLVGARTASSEAYFFGQITALAAMDYALAENITELSATAAGNTASIGTIQQVIAGPGGGSALVGFYTDVNGFIAGDYSFNDGTTATRAFLANRFAVIAPGSAPGSTPIVPFEIVGGVNYLKNTQIDGNLIVNGTITNNGVLLNTITGIQFSDTAGTITLSGTTPVKVCEVFIDVEKANSPVIIDFGCMAYLRHDPSGSFNCYIDYKRRPAAGSTYTTIKSRSVRGPATTFDAINGPFRPPPLSNKPGVGSWGYSVWMYFDVSNMTEQVVTDPYISAIENKTST